MSNKEFLAFVTKQNEPIRTVTHDRAEAVIKWQKSLEDLLSEVADYLDPYVEGGTISLKYENIEMNEEFLGSYSTRKLKIKIGLSEAELVPVGKMIFGAHGRVDLIGKLDKRKIVLVPKAASRTIFQLRSEQEMQADLVAKTKPPELAWKFSLGPRVDYVELNKETFQAELMRVSG